MKRFLLFVLAIGFGVSVFAQYKPVQNHRNVVKLMQKQNVNDAVPGNKPANVIVSSRSVMDDPQIMMTNYDLMTNSSSIHQRLYYWPDGTISAAATIAHDQTSAYPSRGTGYNYFDGTNWGPMPATRIETVRTGWPCIQPYGASGECVISHISGTVGMIFAKRAAKGTGAWTESTVPSPSPETAMLWPRMVTNGADHMNIHLIALTPPTGNGGVAYNGMDGALLYCRSTDGGATWENWQQLAGMTTSDILAFSGDAYTWAMPHGDTLAFVVSDAWYDCYIMKSTDNGATWTKTIVYDSPYDMDGTGAQSPNFFYAPDGTSTVALDKNGNAHVAFGLGADSLYATAGYYYYRAFTQGVVYWNESMPTLRQDLDPDSLLANNQLVGWVLDTMIYYQGSSPDFALASYSISLTGQVSMVIDNDNNLFLIWTCPTVNLDPDGWMLRHTFGRSALISAGTSVEWNPTINDLNSDFLYTNTECMYPEISQTASADNFYVMFMADDYAGAYMKGLNVTGYAGQTAITDNYQTVLTIPKSSVGVGISEKKNDVSSLQVSNYPNPFKGTTSITIATRKAGNLTIDVTNLTGQKVMSINKGYMNAGTSHYTIDCSQLAAGVYFYTVTVNGESRTMKMIVN